MKFNIEDYPLLKSSAKSHEISGDTLKLVSEEGVEFSISLGFVESLSEIRGLDCDAELSSLMKINTEMPD